LAIGVEIAEVGSRHDGAVQDQRQLGLLVALDSPRLRLVAEAARARGQEGAQRARVALPQHRAELCAVAAPAAAGLAAAGRAAPSIPAGPLGRRPPRARTAARQAAGRAARSWCARRAGGATRALR